MCLLSSFSFPGGGFGQNVLTFGVDMSSPVHIDNKKKNILVLGKGLLKNCTRLVLLLVTYLLMARKFTNLKQSILKF